MLYIVAFVALLSLVNFVVNWAGIEMPPYLAESGSGFLVVLLAYIRKQ